METKSESGSRFKLPHLIDLLAFDLFIGVCWFIDSLFNRSTNQNWSKLNEEYKIKYRKMIKEENQP